MLCQSLTSAGDHASKMLGVQKLETHEYILEVFKLNDKCSKYI